MINQTKWHSLLYSYGTPAAILWSLVRLIGLSTRLKLYRRILQAWHCSRTVSPHRILLCRGLELLECRGAGLGVVRAPRDRSASF